MLVMVKYFFLYKFKSKYSSFLIQIERREQERQDKKNKDRKDKEDASNGNIY